MNDANTHYTNEYHADQERRSNDSERKLAVAAVIVDDWITNDEIKSVEIDEMTLSAIAKALQCRDLTEVGRLFREAAIEYVVTTL